LDEHLSDRWTGKDYRSRTSTHAFALAQAALHPLNKLSLDATEFFCIPPNRVVEVGAQIEI
jgi:hypothetical protein